MGEVCCVIVNCGDRQVMERLSKGREGDLGKEEGGVGQ